MTIAAKKWLDAVCSLGCIVCRNEGLGETPAEPHHILHAGRRIDDLHTIPLCVRHHRSGSNNSEWVSRHPYREEFIKRYGAELELLEQCRELLRVAA